MPTYYLGLDVHKVRTQYCLMDPAGEILAEGNVPTEEVASLVPDADCAVVLEATGSWHAAYDALVATGATVKLAHPSHIKAIASARVKTDKIDARILAHLLRADLIPEAWAPPHATSANCGTSCACAGASSRSAPPPRTASPTCSPASACATRVPISSAEPAERGSPELELDRPYPRPHRPAADLDRGGRRPRECSHRPPARAARRRLRHAPAHDHPRRRLHHRSDAHRRARRLAAASPLPGRSPPTSASSRRCGPRPPSPTTDASPARGAPTRGARWSKPRTSP